MQDRAQQELRSGVAFAPVPRDYSFKLNKKEKRAALLSALSDSVATGKLIVVDELKFDAPKTKEFVKVLDNLKVAGKALVVVEGTDANVSRSAANIPTVKMFGTNELNVYDVLDAKTVILTKDAAAKIEEVYA